MNEEIFPPPSQLEADNIPQYSVSEISGSIKRVLEGAFGRIRVRGEITEFKKYSSGHMYFSLKDEGGKIAAVIWRGVASRLKLTPENGLEVVATGKISSYGERSSYQLMVDMLDYAGEGAILARIERLRLKLAEEGIFDEAHKRPLPFLPNVIGVITSLQGAVLHDIQITLARRFSRHLIIWPVAVQGAGAAEQIAAAVEGFNIMAEKEAIPRVDLLIVARGGGSLEDLMAFNDEAVVRAVAASHIPVISAVGHETDTTLIDFVADRRAPTPTAAAEIAVPIYTDLLADLTQKQARLMGGIGKTLQQAHLRLSRMESALPDLPAILQGFRMRLDDRSHRLGLALPILIERKKTQLERSGKELIGSFQGIERNRHKVFLLHARLEGAMQGCLQLAERKYQRCSLAPSLLQMVLRHSQARLQTASSVLEATSPLAVLSRGYVAVKNISGKMVVAAKGIRAGAKLILVFADGKKTVTVQKDPAKNAQQNLEL
ncbi:exodeoxyribonuclease VII large subunit [Entomobacter blattae]|uniref:Exodeoxyribonuclease 7 large subunit n=1 Tax=Entomobacter blattae TaxID=2762277 RepID=A0A7H1NPI6_9PROT|nr:exodeoxyribonuclease VII large subunit [Entomobacter blattae]QNT77696.1 Exodeoxyribonuclease 7 large subunit [Entomobacter blattae]